MVGEEKKLEEGKNFDFYWHQGPRNAAWSNADRLDPKEGHEKGPFSFLSNHLALTSHNEPNQNNLARPQQPTQALALKCGQPARQDDTCCPHTYRVLDHEGDNDHDNDDDDLWPSNPLDPVRAIAASTITLCNPGKHIRIRYSQSILDGSSSH